MSKFQAGADWIARLQLQTCRLSSCDGICTADICLMPRLGTAGAVRMLPAMPGRLNSIVTWYLWLNDMHSNLACLHAWHNNLNSLIQVPGTMLTAYKSWREWSSVPLSTQTQSWQR